MFYTNPCLADGLYLQTLSKLFGELLDKPVYTSISCQFHVKTKRILFIANILRPRNTIQYNTAVPNDRTQEEQ